jgi:hypothetical protein
VGLEPCILRFRIQGTEKLSVRLMLYGLPKNFVVRNRSQDVEPPEPLLGYIGFQVHITRRNLETTCMNQARLYLQLGTYSSCHKLRWRSHPIHSTIPTEHNEHQGSRAFIPGCLHNLGSSASFLQDHPYERDQQLLIRTESSETVLVRREAASQTSHVQTRSHKDLCYRTLWF